MQLFRNSMDLTSCLSQLTGTRQTVPVVPTHWNIVDIVKQLMKWRQYSGDTNLYSMNFPFRSTLPNIPCNGIRRNRWQISSGRSSPSTWVTCYTVTRPNASSSRQSESSICVGTGSNPRAWLRAPDSQAVKRPCGFFMTVSIRDRKKLDYPLISLNNDLL